MPGLYALVLVVTLACLGLIDQHHKLVFFKDARRAWRVIITCLVIFVVWDIAGIMLGIFSIGDTAFLTGLKFGHNFPVEELLFLTVLVYTPLLVSQYLHEERGL